jgi:hypothetical protein
MPQPQHQSKNHKLRAVVAAVDEPEFERALGKLVIDTEARRHQGETDQQAGAKPGAGPSKKANASAAIREKAKLTPNTLAG